MKELYVLPGQGAGTAVGGRAASGKHQARFESDADYFHRRAGEERDFADTIDDARVRSLHLELADRFEALAKELGQPTS